MADALVTEPSRKEVGYVLLDDCEVVVPKSSFEQSYGQRDEVIVDSPFTSTSPSCAAGEALKFETGLWYDVDLSSSDGDDVGYAVNDLVIHPFINDSRTNCEENGLRWKTSYKIPPFNGLATEIHNSSSGSTPNENSPTHFLLADNGGEQEAGTSSPKSRSDALLLAGLAIEINRQAAQFNQHMSNVGESKIATECSSQTGDESTSPSNCSIENSNFRFLEMENARIMILDDEDLGNYGPLFDNRSDERNAGSSDSSSNSSPDELVRLRAAFLVTFSLPTRKHDNIDNGANNFSTNPQPATEHIKNGKNKKSKNTNGKEILSHAYQLIGSIIRCDWGHLTTTLKKLEQRADCKKKAEKERRESMRAELKSQSETSVEEDDAMQDATNDAETISLHSRHHQSTRTSFFPTSLSVEALYERISGASKHLGHDIMMTNQGMNEVASESFTCVSDDNSKFDRDSNEQSTQEVSILNLPDDVIASYIAPYLRARSLHAFRSANRRMHQTLCAVVPGLKLKLFHHQIRSLEWMERRERYCIREDDVICQLGNNHKSTTAEYCLHEGESVCGGDYHRAITGGETVLLTPRPDQDHAESVSSEVIMRFDSRTGVHIPTNKHCLRGHSKGAARGGLLCDDPGLGKTVTVMSLILRSFGLSVEPAVGSQSENEDALDDDTIFDAYWQSDFLTRHVRAPAMNTLLTELLDSDVESGYFVPPVKTFLGICPDYLDVIEKPISIKEIRKKLEKSDGKDFCGFVADVKLCLENAMVYNPPDNIVHQAAVRLFNNFDDILKEFKRKQIRTAIKSISRMSKQGSSLVDMLEARKKMEVQMELIPSSSTLLVVPNPLLKHWEEQMLSHIDFTYLDSNGAAKVYYHTSRRDIAKTPSIWYNLDGCLTYGESPLLLFIDDGSKELPPPDVLARFHIVLTCYSRFTGEWRHGSVEQELKAKRSKETNIYFSDCRIPEASPLLKLHWLRLIVDEGHTMGKNPNNAIQFASWINAQRRWAMTGTPTQQIATQNGLRNLFFLANFLKHDFFSRHFGRELVWNDLINRGWNEGNIFSFFRLQHLISFLMVRHTKADLVEIPLPIYSTKLIDLSESEIKAYNTIASGIRTNIITTSMEGKTSGWQDSLLNPRQAKYASEALTNLRVACVGGCQILPYIEQEFWIETLELLRRVHSLDDMKVKIVNDFIHRAQLGELSSCFCCGIQLQTLFVIPCGCLVCTECIDNKTTSCPVCDKPFDVDDFQRLQPGIHFKFCQNLQEEKKEREQKNALRRVLADSTHTTLDDENIDLEEIGDIEPVNSQGRKHKPGEDCTYSRRYGDGKCKICKEEHFECNFMNSSKQCSICFKLAEECPDYASKAKYVIEKLLKLRRDDVDNTINVSPLAARFFAKSGRPPQTHRPLKCIIFSTFRAGYEYLGDRLLRAFGGACVADYSYSKTRTQELQKFIHDPNCFVMLLSKQGSHGLDLSFVSHIFFLDTIYDKSLENQVVARAYRMGATGPVHVEQLTAKDSIEEVMHEMNVQNDGHDESETTDNKEKHAKMHILLKRASLIKTHKEIKKKRKLPLAIANDQANDAESNAEERKPSRVRFKD